MNSFPFPQNNSVKIVRWKCYCLDPVFPQILTCSDNFGRWADPVGMLCSSVDSPLMSSVAECTFRRWDLVELDHQRLIQKGIFLSSGPLFSFYVLTAVGWAAFFFCALLSWHFCLGASWSWTEFPKTMSQMKTFRGPLLLLVLSILSQQLEKWYMKFLIYSSSSSNKKLNYYALSINPSFDTRQHFFWK